jgi:uncharacterized protein (DUF58 family)
MSLSRVSLLLIGLMSLLAVIGIWTGAPLHGLWHWPAVLFISLIAWERFKLTADYTIQRQVADTLELGITIDYTVTLKNQGLPCLKIETQADYPDSVEGDSSLDYWSLHGDETESRRVSICPILLGDSSLGSLYLRQPGFLGLCWWTRRIDNPADFRVVPVRLGKTPPVSGTQQMGDRSSHFQHSSGVDLLELRDYHPGDSLRSIDWKATARRGKQMVRRFEREHRLEIVVLIDCGRSSRMYYGRLSRLHHYINVASKLAEFAAGQGDQIACIAYGQQTLGTVPMTGGIKAIKAIRHLLGGLSSTSDTANALNAAFDVKQMLKHRGLVIFLTEVEQPEAATQLIQAGQLLATQHQVLVATLEDTAIADGLKQKARYWLDPYRHFALLEYQRGQELSCKELQRKGIAIVRAPAKHLDQQVLGYYQNKRDKIGGA